jgi:uncharacterized protein (DUF1778 family)
MDKNKTNETKRENIHIRATKSQKEFLDMLCYETDKNKTDMIFKALEFYYNFNKGKF